MKGLLRGRRLAVHARHGHRGGAAVRFAGHLLLCGWGYPWGYSAAPGFEEWRFTAADGV